MRESPASLRSKRFREAKSEEKAKNGGFGVLPARKWGSRPIFRAGETLKTRFFALFYTETLAMQANRQGPVVRKTG